MATTKNFTAIDPNGMSVVERVKAPTSKFLKPCEQSGLCWQLSAELSLLLPWLCRQPLFLWPDTWQ